MVGYFLGDGINDAPFVAHRGRGHFGLVGGGRGPRGRRHHPARKPGLNVLHRGIIEGRRAFGNVTKYLLMGTSSNFGNMFSMAGASVFLPFFADVAETQVLLNNLLYDLAQVTIPTDNVDPEVIRKPQRWDIRTIRNFMLIIGPISSLS